MKITCLGENLKRAVTTSERLVGKKESLPVLSCILITAEKGSLTLQATNLEAGIRVTIPAEVTEEGALAVPASILSSIIRVTHGDKVTLEGDDASLSVKSRSGTTSIRAIPREEFPTIPFPDGKTGIPLSRPALVEGLQSVMYAASHSMIRPELASISMQYADGSLVFAATDSFRLAEKRVIVPVKSAPPDILIPQKNAAELLHVLTTSEESEVSLSVEEAEVYIEIGGGSRVQFVSRIIDATFPNYRDVIPKAFSTEATILTKDFSEALKKAKLFSNASQQVSFHLYPQKKVFSVTAQNQEVGEMDDTLDAAVQGEDIDINFNSSYIAECLQSVHTDSLTLGFAGAGRPLVVKPVGDQTFTYLVMPLNR